jgi:hypothetical protein
MIGNVNNKFFKSHSVALYTVWIRCPDVKGPRKTHVGPVERDVKAK